jgi:hypothetical protein
MKNRDIYVHDPCTHELLNNGVAEVKDTGTAEELKTLHYELSTFVCDGQYEKGLLRMLESYLRNLDQPEQPSVWVSGFYGSGKSHLVKMLRALWVDTRFPDGSSARGLAKLPESVSDALRELSTAGRRVGGLHAAAGTLGAGKGDQARLALLAIVFRSAGLPEQYPLARFVIRLREIGKLDDVRGRVEAKGKSWDSELRNLHVSPVIAEALVAAGTGFGDSPGEVREALRAQYPARVSDVDNTEMVQSIRDALSVDGQLPCTLIALDEVQQFINEMGDRARVIQEIAEACRTKFAGRVLLVSTGQSALAGTPQLQKLQDRFPIRVQLSDEDVETVIRKIVLQKKPAATDRVAGVLESHSGEISRQLVGTKLGPQTEDPKWMVADYPLLPTRRRFWERALRAVDQAGTQGQLRNQLKTVHEAARATAEQPIGNVVGGDFLFDQQAVSLLQTGALSQQVYNFIQESRKHGGDGDLKGRLVALVYLIGKLPRQGQADLGIRAVPDLLADLLVTDLSAGSANLRRKVPELLQELENDGQLMKVEDEYRLQTAEGAEWESEYRNRFNAIKDDQAKVGSERAELLHAEASQRIGNLKVLQGSSRFPREVKLHFGVEAPKTDGTVIPVWVRDGWSDDEQSFMADARRGGNDDPTIFVWIPRRSAEDVNSTLAARRAARETLDVRGVPSSQEGREARSAIQGRESDAQQKLQRTILPDIFAEARVVQAGGQEVGGGALKERVQRAAENSLVRLFPQFDVADHTGWAKTMERARKGDGDPLQAVGWQAETEKHPVTSAVLTFVGAGKSGAEIRKKFEGSPYGWPSDAVDGALYALLATGHLRASLNQQQLDAKGLERKQISGTQFRRENIVFTSGQRLLVRKLLQTAGATFTPGTEGSAVPALLDRLREAARSAGGEPPLPERPGTQHVEEIAARSGNDQLVALADARERLEADLEAWRATAAKATKRIERWERLQRLFGFAAELPGADAVRKQIESIRDKRQLLHDPDPVDSQVQQVIELLRGALLSAEQSFRAVFERELQALEESDVWAQLNDAEREEIRRSFGIVAVPTIKTGTEADVLASLQTTSLREWRDRRDALPRRFEQARDEAARRVEPEMVKIKLPGGTFRQREEVDAYLEQIRETLYAQLEAGPVRV